MENKKATADALELSVALLKWKYIALLTTGEGPAQTSMPILAHLGTLEDMNQCSLPHTYVHMHVYVHSQDKWMCI